MCCVLACFAGSGEEGWELQAGRVRGPLITSVGPLEMLAQGLTGLGRPGPEGRAVWKFEKTERVKSDGKKCNVVLLHIKRERGADRERRAFQEHCSYVTMYVTTIERIII